MVEIQLNLDILSYFGVLVSVGVEFGCFVLFDYELLVVNVEIWFFVCVFCLVWCELLVVGIVVYCDLLLCLDDCGVVVKCGYMGIIYFVYNGCYVGCFVV